MKAPVHSQEPIAAAVPQTGTAVDPVERPVGRSLWGIGYLLIGVAWLVFLAVLAATTSNPATLNLVQIRESQAVLLVRIADPERGQLQIEQILREAPPVRLQPGDTLQVTPGLPHWKSGDLRIVPVRLTRNGTWEITPAPHPRISRLDYPAEQRLIDQIQ